MENIIMIVLGLLIMIVVPILKAKNKVQADSKEIESEDRAYAEDLFSDFFTSSKQMNEKSFSFQYAENEKEITKKQPVQTVSELTVCNKINTEKNVDKEAINKNITQQKRMKKKVDLKKAMIYKTILERPYC